MNNTLITHNILLFFVQGVYFLLIAIFAFRLLKQYNVRIKLFTGALLFMWVLLNIKDLIIHTSPECTDIERANWITMIDQLAIPMIGITMRELGVPQSFTPTKACLHFLPFVTLLVIFCLFPCQLVVNIAIIHASIYSAYIVITTSLLLRSVPRQSARHKTILNISLSFLVAICIWTLSCVYPSFALDITYYIVSGIAWCIIYYHINNIYQPQSYTPASSDNNPQPTETPETPVEVDKSKSYAFVATLNKLLDQERIYLNSNMTLNDVARMIGTNRSYLSDYFNHELNTPFSDYINNLRLTHAEELMSTNPIISIDEISSASGFNSTTTFRRAFAKKHGITPSQYRLNLANNQG